MVKYFRDEQRNKKASKQEAVPILIKESVRIMTNKVPSVVKQYINQPTNHFSHLCFEDWIEKEIDTKSKWIVVATSSENTNGSWLMYSALAKLNKGLINRLFSQSENEVTPKFGHPFFYSLGSEKIAHYDQCIKSVKNGITFMPFTIFREFQQYIEPKFELIQSFILYHEAFFDQDKKEYYRVDDSGDILKIAKIIEKQNENTIIIDSYHLKDYLAANKCILVRYHNNSRKSILDMNPFLEDSFEEYRITNHKNYSFNLWLRTDLPEGNYISSSRIYGKDVIMPLPTPDNRHTWFATGERYKKFLSFIINVDDEGRNIECTCNENELSNYYSDTGKPHYLTPVFFTPNVLSRYYEEPRKYSVQSDYVSCLCLWGIPIDFNDDDLIQVWLGDLGKIPYKEQLHWKQYNVFQKATITEHRWKRDFLAQWAWNNNDPIGDLKYIYYKIQSHTEKIYKERVFLKLDERDIHNFSTLHIPVTNEWKEFDQQVQAIAKTFIDSINISLLKRLSKAPDTINNSINYLEFFLNGNNIPENIISSTITPFRAVQAVRSTGVAHRKGKKFDKTLTSHQLSHLSNPDRLRNIVTDLNNALRLFLHTLLVINT